MPEQVRINTTVGFSNIDKSVMDERIDMLSQRIA